MTLHRLLLVPVLIYFCVEALRYLSNQRVCESVDITSLDGTFGVIAAFPEMKMLILVELDRLFEYLGRVLAFLRWWRPLDLLLFQNLLTRFLLLQFQIMYQFDWSFYLINALNALIPDLILLLFWLSRYATLAFILFLFSALVTSQCLILFLCWLSLYRVPVCLDSSQRRLRLLCLLHGCLEIHFLRTKLNSPI